jgi:hypothetical protein
MITYIIWKRFYEQYIINDYYNKYGSTSSGDIKTPEEKASNFVICFLINILILPIEIFLIPSSIVYFISLKYFKHQEEIYNTYLFNKKIKGELNEKQIIRKN